MGRTITLDLELSGAGNIDHLAVGPSRVFVLDSKAWSGVVIVNQGRRRYHTAGRPPSGGACTRATPWSRPHDRPGDPRTRRRDRDDGSGRAQRGGRLGPFPQRVATSGEVACVAG